MNFQNCKFSAMSGAGGGLDPNNRKKGHSPIFPLSMFWYLVKTDTSVRYCTIAHTGQVTFQNSMAMYSWLLCIIYT